VTNKIVASLSGEARDFYDREFGFFNEVTSISGKLKPYIKKTKPEKKAKIDEEMAKIQMEVGVYLPSNPDGKVVDIDRKSGRPLQSHAKAPFMATFKVRKERTIIDVDPDSVLDGEGHRSETHAEYDIWQQAMFKVGDDCRQDVLALQVIAMFKNIFTGVGLTLYLYPYRVTATGPGCGVIDVVPDATSRDEMGRATVNDLMDFFVAKYGGEHTVAFQKARLNFIQSMAAYSVACYILQIKDRHNGNIMIDGEGHIVHIDFGFLFDIGPGGVKFEPNSFKLTHEMVVLMGGRSSQGYAMFQQLTVKAFLALRPYADQLVSTVQLMLDTGLPSFKGEATIKRLRDRFALGLSERHAAEWMMGVVKNAHENVRSTAYDEFQRVSAFIYGVIHHADYFYSKLQNGTLKLLRTRVVDMDLIYFYKGFLTSKDLHYIHTLGIIRNFNSLLHCCDDMSRVRVFKQTLGLIRPDQTLTFLKYLLDILRDAIFGIIRKDGNVALAQGTRNDGVHRGRKAVSPGVLFGKRERLCKRRGII